MLGKVKVSNVLRRYVRLRRTTQYLWRGSLPKFSDSSCKASSSEPLPTERATSRGTAYRIVVDGRTAIILVVREFYQDAHEAARRVGYAILKPQKKVKFSKPSCSAMSNIGASSAASAGAG